MLLGDVKWMYDDGCLYLYITFPMSKLVWSKIHKFVIFRFNLTDHETNVLANMKSSIKTELVSSEELPFDYPGIFQRSKGPNPLSCKPKKKKNDEDNIPKVENKTKRKRNRIKIPKHVKEELKKKSQQISKT